MDALDGQLDMLILSLGLLAVLVYLILRDRKTPLKWSKNAPDPIEALVARRNWHHAYSGPKPGYGRKSAAQRVLGDKDDPDAWEVVITSRSRSGIGRDADVPGDTIFRAPAPVFPRDLAIFAAPIPATSPTPFDPLRDMAGMEDRRLRTELREMLGKTFQPDLDALSSRPVPGGNTITVLATRDPSGRFDIAEVARLLTRWTALHPMTSPPRLVIDGYGMMLYLRDALGDPDAISTFVSMAFDLRAAARGAQVAQGRSAPPPDPSANPSVSRSSLS